MTFGPYMGVFSNCEFAEKAVGMAEMYRCPDSKTGSVLTIKAKGRTRLVLCEVFMFATGGSPK